MQKINADHEYLKSIDVCGMAEPAEWKYEYYEQYYFRTGRLPFAVLVDENRRLRDGYIAYLLWQVYGAEPDVWELNSSRASMKTVTGRHAVRLGEGFCFRGSERDTLVYDLEDPVVPGDVVIVELKKGYAYLGVEEVRYVAGQASGGQYRKVRKHTGCRMDI